MSTKGEFTVNELKARQGLEGAQEAHMMDLIQAQSALIQDLLGRVVRLEIEAARLQDKVSYLQELAS